MPGEKQVEAAAQIKFAINGNDLRVAQIETTINVNVEMIYGNNLRPDGWAVTDMSFEGSLSFNGDVVDEVNSLLADNLEPKEGNSITITHMDGSSNTFEDVFLTQQGYTMNEEEVTETTYEWVAMDHS